MKSKIINKFPFLPNMPTKILGKTTATRRLTNRKNSEWLFMPYIINDIPSPYSENQDYDFNKLQKSLWCDIKVPGSVIMQGFDIKNNNEYYYKTSIFVDKTKDAEAYLHFEGVYSNSRIWINNKYVMTHIGGFTPFDIKIETGTNEIVIGFSDIEGNTVGIWNPNGTKMSDAAWASYYAHNNIGGILRDISLYYLPNNFILKESYNTKIKDNIGIIEGSVLIKSDKICKIVVEVWDNKKLITKTVALNVSDYDLASCNHFTYDINKDENFYNSDYIYSPSYISYNNCERYENIKKVDFSIEIENAKLWTAETPNLYNIVITLFVDNIDTQTNENFLGIREIIYNGKNGTDKNKLYINGKQVKLRGVCRHDISHIYGRSITSEDEYKEIIAYKNNNINFVRTSHYPASKNFVELCDKLGIYVEMENAVCFKGSNGYDMLCSGEQIVQNLFEMLSYYANSTSIIIWSIANESGFEKSKAFRMSYEQIKTIDITRPTIFSYPFTVKTKPIPYDIFSKHYNSVIGKVGKSDIPMLHDEFAHVACYNINEIRRDNNYRLAWAESIKKGWDNIFNTDGALGCAIWGGIDEVFYIPEECNGSHQKHTSGKAVGYGEWGAVLDVFKREKPEAYLTKKAFSPIKINNYELRKDIIELNVLNRFDHINLNRIRFLIKENKKTVKDEFIKESILPHSSGIIKINYSTAKNSELLIEFYLEDIMVESELLKNAEQSNNALALLGNNVAVDEENSFISIMNAKQELAKGPYLVINDRIVKSKSRKIIRNKYNTLTIIEIFGKLSKVIYHIKFTKTNVIVSMKVSKLIRTKVSLDYGCAFVITKDVISSKWEKKCFYNVYPDNHLERDNGKAVVTKSPNIYGICTNENWKDDEINYFLEDKISNKIPISNDFKARRTNINNYFLKLKDCTKFGIAKTNQNIDVLTTIMLEHSEIDLNSIIKLGKWVKKKSNSIKQHYVSKKINSSMQFEFLGTSISILGTLSKKQGEFEISIDGKKEKVSTKSDICERLDFTVLYTQIGLENKLHNVTITACDNKGVKISCIKITHQNETLDKNIFITKGNFYPSLLWGNYCGKKLSNKEKKYLEFKILL